MKVFISRNIPEKAIDLLEAEGLNVVINKENKILADEELIAACQDVDLLLNVGHAALNETFFAACPTLKGIALASVGYDHLDVAAANKHRVPVSNTPGVLSGATADTAFLLMLAVSRKAFGRARDVVSGKWKDFDFVDGLGIELNGKTLGIFGLGRIGLELAKKAKGAYGMKIIYHNRSRNEDAESELAAEYVSFEELLAQSDVISVHANLSSQTQYKFDYAAFQQMKSSSIFVNTARGKVHQEQDLIRALGEGQIWGAGLDVTDPEPMSPNNPLLEMSNVCILPHIGSATVETRTAMALMAARNLIAVAKGEKMPQVVNSEVYI